MQEQCHLEQGSAYYRKTTQYTYTSSLHDAREKGSLKYCLQNKSQHEANYQVLYWAICVIASYYQKCGLFHMASGISMVDNTMEHVMLQQVWTMNNLNITQQILYK